MFAPIKRPARKNSIILTSVIYPSVKCRTGVIVIKKMPVQYGIICCTEAAKDIVSLTELTCSPPSPAVAVIPETLPPSFVTIESLTNTVPPDDTDIPLSRLSISESVIGSELLSATQNAL